MYNLEAMKPLVQKQLDRYISENENIEKQNNRFVCKSCRGKGVDAYSRYIVKGGTSYACTQCSSTGDIFVLFNDYENGYSDRQICEILVERFGLVKELSKNHFSLTDAKTLYNDEFKDLNLSFHRYCHKA